MSIVQKKIFDQSEIESISKALGNTVEGLTGNEIADLLKQANIPDISTFDTKWIRLYNAFVSKQNCVNNRTNILQFIRLAMKPAKFIGKKEKFNLLKSNLNMALSFSGLELKETGELVNCNKITTLTEAETRARELKINLDKRDIHQDVMKFCQAELLQNNYFHAVLEAVKSIFDKLRKIIDSTNDGHELANQCFGGENPKLRINAFKTKSEKSEQSGFNELIKGVYSMFRNTTAHEAKVNWQVTQRDAEDLLTMVSMIHRRIDTASK